MADTHWITLHRLRLPTTQSALVWEWSQPEGPECWRFCPEHTMGEDGLPTYASDIWCGFGIHDSEEEAQAFYAEAETRLSDLPEPVEAWHALARPIAHHGVVKWRSEVEENAALRTAKSEDEGPLIVMTTAGYKSRDASQIPRIKSFMVGIGEVMTAYRSSEGVLAVSTFNGGFDGRDGFTLSIWADDRAMISAAYKPGVHRTQMDMNEGSPFFDRSSFTRARLVKSRGHWDGAALGVVA